MSYICPDHQAALAADPERLRRLIGQWHAQAQQASPPVARAYQGQAFEACLLLAQSESFAYNDLLLFCQQAQAHAQILQVLTLDDELEHCLWLHHRAWLEALNQPQWVRQYWDDLLRGLEAQELRLMACFQARNKQVQAAQVAMTSRQLRRVSAGKYLH